MDAEPHPIEIKSWPRFLIGGLMIARLLMLLALPLEGLRGYGDFQHFFNLAAIPGWPYLDHWVEFPPIFPFLIELLYRISGAQQHTFDYLLFFILTAADVGSLLVFGRLLAHLNPPSALKRWLMYALALVALAYAWWYFDSLPVLALLLGLLWIIEGREWRAGAVLGLGLITKLFPALALAAAWRLLPPRRALRVTLLTLGIGLIAYGGLYLAAPRFTAASLISQGAKGSWETVWALVDGNLRTGSFGPLVERLDPALANVSSGQPARIPTWIPLGLAAALGFWRFLKARRTPLAALALTGLAWCLLMLASPGWSVQWTLYALPFVLLLLPDKEAPLLVVTFTLVNLLEWPILLSRGLFWAMPLTIILRALLLVLLAIRFDQRARQP
ncbi:MAG TPA: glycosyltransferase 87 family protein [Anaerolineaceae bacterium]|nr:glycosyltransferase 87 family protein [Anaerolineaceae bacterium]